jgi:HAMP domain-containing protein
MAGVLFIVIVFGGGMLFALSKSEIGRAVADRIRAGSPSGTDPALLDEVERLRQEVSELHERMGFTERLLAAQREAERLPGGPV